MPEGATYEQLEGQLDMWKDFATPACDERAIECLAAGIA
jgi:hypothetical protein